MKVKVGSVITYTIVTCTAQLWKSHSAPGWGMSGILVAFCVSIKVSGRVGLFYTAADPRLMQSWKAAMGNSMSDIRLLVSRCHSATNKC